LKITADSDYLEDPFDFLCRLVWIFSDKRADPRVHDGRMQCVLPDNTPDEVNVPYVVIMNTTWGIVRRNSYHSRKYSLTSYIRINDSLSCADRYGMGLHEKQTPSNRD
jgi:hypothetical protein